MDRGAWSLFLITVCGQNYLAFYCRLFIIITVKDFSLNFTSYGKMGICLNRYGVKSVVMVCTLFYRVHTTK